MRWIMIILLIPTVLAATSDMYIFAVTETGKGMPAKLTVDVREGNGNVLLNLKSLVGIDTQESILNAIIAGITKAGEQFDRYDYIVTIESEGASKVDGPSAGLPIALSVYAAVKGIDIPDNISGTGTIDRWGNVGPVGGIFEKVKAAHEMGIEVFLIPYGEEIVEATILEETEPGVVAPVNKVINIVDYAKKEWNMNIYPVKTLDEAISIVIEGARPEINTEDIEVTEVPEVNFIPSPVSPKYSDAFKAVVEKLIEELEQTVSITCNSNDPAVDRLLESGRSYLERAKLVLDKGYYYTAGNFAFLGIINASTAKDLCLHPSISDPTSLSYITYVRSLVKKLEDLTIRAEDVTVNINNYELVAGARERIVRAESYLSSELPSLVQLKSVEYWLWTAEKLLEMAETIKGEQISVDVEEVVRNKIIELEDIITRYSINNPQISERLSWAKALYDKGWYIAAFYEAVLAESTLVSENSTNVINYTITPTSMWSELYYYHGLYYQQAAEVYRENNRPDEAEEMMKTAIQMFETSRQLETLNKYIMGSYTTVKNDLPSPLFDYLPFISATLAAVIVLLLLLSLKAGSRTGTINTKRLNEIEGRLLALKAKGKLYTLRLKHRLNRMKKRLKLLKEL